MNLRRLVALALAGGIALVAGSAAADPVKVDGGVVYVTIAYRLGAMGFLAHPGLTAEGRGHSGNYGLMDQVAALEWLGRNVAAFGGDSGNVTVMRQSARPPKCSPRTARTTCR